MPPTNPAPAAYQRGDLVVHRTAEHLFEPPVWLVTGVADDSSPDHDAKKYRACRQDELGTTHQGEFFGYELTLCPADVLERHDEPDPPPPPDEPHKKDKSKKAA